MRGQIIGRNCGYADQIQLLKAGDQIVPFQLRSVLRDARQLTITAPAKPQSKAPNSQVGSAKVIYWMLPLCAERVKVIFYPPVQSLDIGA